MMRRGPIPFPNEMACPVSDVYIQYTSFGAKCKEHIYHYSRGALICKSLSRLKSRSERCPRGL